jgi:hypothetical protein
LASIVGLQREMDLSVGQGVSPSQRSAPSDLSSTSYGLDPAALPRELSSPYGRDFDRAMVSQTEFISFKKSILKHFITGAVMQWKVY